LTHLHYTLDARGGRDHRFELALQLDVHSQHGDVELLLPVWTPGSYLIREFERHVGDVRAHDVENGAPLRWSKSAKNRFRVHLARDTRRLRVDYSVFAHELTVRTADLTDEHAFWNGACLFLWPAAEREAGATIDILLPPQWEVFTWLPTDRDGHRARVQVAGLDQLADSPMLCAPSARVVEFEVLGRPHRFVFDGMAGIEPPPSLAADTRAVVAEAARVFGVDALPYHRYDFLTLATDKGHGGLEHADGSVLITPRTSLSTKRGYREFMGLVAHEYFHVFNVKRLRPVELWRVDFESENHTRLLWVAEGFTAYYDDLLCRRAGVLPVSRYLQIVADNIADARRTPGRLHHSLAEASYDAWIKFYRPDEDSRNSSQSYYVNGSLAALCLDLEIRRRTHGGRSLDDAMASLWRRTYVRDRGYTHDDVVAALSEAAGADLSGMVADLVLGPFDPDFASVLRPFGLALAATPGAERPAFLGIQLQQASMVVASVQRGGPAARGGIAAGDEVLAFGGLRTVPANFEDVVRALARPGAAVPVLLARRGHVVERAVTPEPAEGRVGYRIDVLPGATAEQDELRRGWLGPSRGEEAKTGALDGEPAADRVV